jgi:hypothetical protein
VFVHIFSDSFKPFYDIKIIYFPYHMILGYNHVIKPKSDHYHVIYIFL